MTRAFYHNTLSKKKSFNVFISFFKTFFLHFVYNKWNRLTRILHTQTLFRKRNVFQTILLNNLDFVFSLFFVIHTYKVFCITQEGMGIRKRRDIGVSVESSKKRQMRFREIQIESILEGMLCLIELQNYAPELHYAIQVKDESNTESKQNRERIQKYLPVLQQDQNCIERIEEKNIYVYDTLEYVLKTWDQICAMMGIVIIRNQKQWEGYLKTFKTRFDIQELRIQWKEFNYFLCDYPPNLEILNMTATSTWKELGSLLFLPASVHTVCLCNSTLKMIPLPYPLPQTLKYITVGGDIENPTSVTFHLPEQTNQLRIYNSMLNECMENDGDLIIYSKEDWDILQSFLFDELSIQKLKIDMLVLDFEITKLPQATKILDLSLLEEYKSPLFLFKESHTEEIKLKGVYLNQNYSFPIHPFWNHYLYVKIVDKNTSSIIFDKQPSLLKSYLKFRHDAKTNGTVVISTQTEYDSIWLQTPIPKFH